jgi:hypothetical protein
LQNREKKLSFELTQNLPPPMTESEFVALALSKYEQIKSLENSADFYQHEKDFDQVWTELGGQVLEKTLGEQPASARKKKRSDPLRRSEPAQRSPL